MLTRQFLSTAVASVRERVGVEGFLAYPAKKTLRSIKAKCKTICRMNVSLLLAVLLHQLNSVRGGWTAYFCPGVSARAFGYLPMIVWRQVFAVATAQTSELGIDGIAGCTTLLGVRGCSHHPALPQLANRRAEILHGCLKNHEHYDESTAWSHRAKPLVA